MTNKTILVIAAHADDEVLGCGGTLLKHRDAGDDIFIIYMTNGVDAREQANELDQQQRLNSQKAVCQQLGVKEFFNLTHPDNKLDSVAMLDIVQSIEPIIRQVNPQIIYTHHGGDLNIDHRIVFQAVMTACRPQPNCSVKQILSFSVNSSTEWSHSSIGIEFTPNYFVDISDVITERNQLLEHYQQEMRDFPHSRSNTAINALSTMRGTQVGVDAAEAFVLIRQIIE